MSNIYINNLLNFHFINKQNDENLYDMYFICHNNHWIFIWQYYLYGHDGSYTNYTSITNRYYKYAYPTISDVLGSLEGDDILNTKSNMIVAENCYIWYNLTVNNGSDPFDSIQFEAGPLYMIKQDVYANSYPSISGTQAVGNTISMIYNYKNYWYNSPDQSSSYIAWYRSTDGYTLPGVNSDSDVGNPVSIKYLLAP